MSYDALCEATIGALEAACVLVESANARLGKSPVASGPWKIPAGSLETGIEVLAQILQTQLQSAQSYDSLRQSLTGLYPVEQIETFIEDPEDDRLSYHGAALSRAERVHAGVLWALALHENASLPCRSYMASSVAENWQSVGLFLKKHFRLYRPERLVARVESECARVKADTLRKEVGNRPPSSKPDADMPSSQDAKGWWSTHDSATEHGLNQDALRKRLKRWRHSNARGWMEVPPSERASKDPQFLYDPVSIRPVIDKMLAKKTSG